MRFNNIPCMFILLLAVLLPTLSYAKGEHVGIWMQGTITELKTNGDKIHFRLSGKLWLVQYRTGEKPAHVEVKTAKPASVTISQNKLFFAMSADGRGGAVRKKGALLKIIKAAIQHKRSIKFQLVDPVIDFGAKENFKLIHSRVIRATDADLR